MSDELDYKTLADEWGWKSQAVAFAIGYCDGNVADAKAFLTKLADEMDSAAASAEKGRPG